jgi:hypothetical protein
MSDVENPRTLVYPKIVSRTDWLSARKDLPFYMDGSYRAAVDLKP